MPQCLFLEKTNSGSVAYKTLETSPAFSPDSYREERKAQREVKQHLLINSK